jgi:hypothetical protein
MTAPSSGAETPCSWSIAARTTANDVDRQRTARTVTSTRRQTALASLSPRHRRTVRHHVIVAAAQALHGVRQRFGGQDGRGIVRRLADQNQVDPGTLVMPDLGEQGRRLIGSHTGTRPRTLCDARTAQVQLEQQHAPAGLRERGGEAEGERGPALLGKRGGYLDHLRRTVVLCLDEREPERAQALRVGGKRALQQVFVRPVLASHGTRQARADREATHAAAGLELADAAHAAAETSPEEAQQRGRWGRAGQSQHRKANPQSRGRCRCRARAAVHGHPRACRTAIDWRSSSGDINHRF